MANEKILLRDLIDLEANLTQEDGNSLDPVVAVNGIDGDSDSEESDEVSNLSISTMEAQLLPQTHEKMSKIAKHAEEFLAEAKKHYADLPKIRRGEDIF